MTSQFCPGCGRGYPDDFLFCTHCGQKLQPFTPEPEPTEAPPPEVPLAQAPPAEDPAAENAPLEDAFSAASPVESSSKGTFSTKLTSLSPKTRKILIALVSIAAILLVGLLARTLLADEDPFEEFYPGRSRSNIIAIYGTPDESDDWGNYSTTINDSYYDLPEFGPGTTLDICYDNERIEYAYFTYAADEGGPSIKKVAQKWYKYYCNRYGRPYDEGYNLVWDTDNGSIYIEKYFIEASDVEAAYFDFYMMWEP